MAKGKAAVSSTGASMSKYDVEVEARLKALEKGLAECKATCAANAAKSSGGSDNDKLLEIEAKVNKLWN